MDPDERPSLPDFLAAEKAGWEEIEALVAALSPEQAERAGYLPGWSVKDFLAHLAGWLSEAGRVLEQIAEGALTEVDLDVDSRNDGYVEANRDQPLSFVLFEVRATRRRLLHHLHDLTDIPAPAVDALRKAGPEHYAEHLPRLREWVAHARSATSTPEP